MKKPPALTCINTPGEVGPRREENTRAAETYSQAAS